MPANQSQGRLIFEKLTRQLKKLSTHPTPESVHKFRTYGRRAEALLVELVPKPGRNHKKLVKMLAKLRDKVGRDRDLEVQIALLRNLKIPEGARQKSQLLAELSEERMRRQKKLESAFDKKSVRELRKRLQRVAGEIRISDGQPLKASLNLLAQLPADPAPLTEKVLHQYRIVGKRARYLAELAGRNAEAQRVVKQLKRMQDVIGNWHDWWKLTQRAERRLGDVQGSPLTAALRNVTRAKFRQAVEVLAQTRSELAVKQPLLVSAPGGRKAPDREPQKVAAAVA
jgi:CHAD domain-containing protein